MSQSPDKKAADHEEAGTNSAGASEALAEGQAGAARSSAEGGRASPPRDASAPRQSSEPSPGRGSSAGPPISDDECDPKCGQAFHCRLCSSNAEALSDPKKRKDRAAGCCGKRPCITTERDISDIITWEAAEAARATNEYYVRLKTGGDLNACIRYQAYRLLTRLERVQEDDRSGGGRRVLLNACLARSILAHHRSVTVAGFKRHTEDSDTDADAGGAVARLKKTRNA